MALSTIFIAKQFQTYLITIFTAANTHKSNQLLNVS